MEHIDYEEEEPITSQTSKQHNKIKRFKEYLVSSQTLHHFVKFLFGLRNKQQHDQSIPNDDALQMFQQYFGALTPDTSEQEALKQQIGKIKSQNAQIASQIEKTKSAVQAKVASIEKAKEEQRLKLEQQAKNPKKAGKK